MEISIDQKRGEVVAAVVSDRIYQKHPSGRMSIYRLSDGTLTYSDVDFSSFGESFLVRQGDSITIQF